MLPALRRPVPELAVVCDTSGSMSDDLLAVALHLQLPVWSNDKDFEGLAVDLFTTERLLRRLGIIH